MMKKHLWPMDKSLNIKKAMNKGSVSTFWTNPTTSKESDSTINSSKFSSSTLCNHAPLPDHIM